MNEETIIQNDSDELLQRRQRLEFFKNLGIDPFGQKFQWSHTIDQACKDFEQSFANDLHTSFQVTVAGRIMALRAMGKASFGNLMDLSGNMQFYVRKDAMKELDFSIFEKLYVGDIIGISGEVFKTQKGELTIRVQSLTLLSCGLRPLPEKFHGLTDKETRYRKRYVDLIVNEQVRKTFIIRSKMISSVRKTLDGKNFLEVETPVLNAQAGGAAARPFVTFHNALKMEFFMRIATELHLKRLLVGGLERVYEIGRIFRNEGVSHKHNPEFTSIEVYQAFADYEDMMELTEEIVVNAALACLGTTKISWDGREIDLKAPWKKISYLGAISEKSGISLKELRSDVETLKSVAIKKGCEIDSTMSHGKIYDLLFEIFVEPHLFEPTFVYDYPVELSPLAKRRADDLSLTYRFEAFVANMEIANAFSELNDPIDQLDRFEMQAMDKEQGDEEAHVTDLDYIEALEYAMPPAGGLGIGIDRLAMLLSGNESIREVILFPHLKNK